MSVEESFNKVLTANDGQANASVPQGQTDKQAPEIATPSIGQADTTQKAPETTPKGQVEREWDGKPETLTNELKQDPKAIQRAYTKKAMALAEAEKKLKEYQGLNQDEITAYKQWKQQQEVAKQQQLLTQPPQPTQLTPEQVEMIKNDPNAFQQYVQSLVNNQLQQAAQVYGQELNQIKYQQSVTQWEQTIADFGEVHPDMWEMYEAGLFKPILNQVVKSGGTLEDAYEQASKIRDSFKTKATIEQNQTIAAKRDASSMPGVNSGTDDTIYVDNKRDSLGAAFELAFTKKEYVDKNLTVTPRGKVKVKK